jgi:hypothetical protein
LTKVRRKIMTPRFYYGIRNAAAISAALWILIFFVLAVIIR